MKKSCIKSEALVKKCYLSHHHDLFSHPKCLIIHGKLKFAEKK